MATRLRGCSSMILVAIALASAAHAGPPRYNLSAQAFGEGDAHESNDDPFVSAHDEEVTETGSGIYDASADASSGGLAASASRAGTLPFNVNQRRSAARIEERIHFDEIPAGSVTIRAELSGSPTVSGQGATAAAGVLLHSTATGTCAGSISVTAAGSEVLAGCPFGDGAGGGFAQITLTPQQLADSGYVVDVDGQVQASVQDVANGTPGQANATGPLSVSILPGTAHHFTGPNTAFPAPEPADSAASAAAIAALAALHRRRSAART